MSINSYDNFNIEVEKIDAIGKKITLKNKHLYIPDIKTVGIENNDYMVLIFDDMTADKNLLDFFNKLYHELSFLVNNNNYTLKKLIDYDRHNDVYIIKIKLHNRCIFYDYWRNQIKKQLLEYNMIVAKINCLFYIDKINLNCDGIANLDIKLLMGNIISIYPQITLRTKNTSNGDKDYLYIVNTSRKRIKYRYLDC